MPEFTYTARDPSGKQVTGSLSANNERDAVNMLSVQELFPVSISTDEKKKPGITLSGGRVKATAIAVFYEQLSSLMANGVPLLRSLTILREQAPNASMQAALADIIQKVEEGDTLADGFARHPKIFDDVAVNMFRAGGEGGFLEEVLARLAIFTEQLDDMRSRTVGALIYPAVLAGIGSIVVTVLLVFFVPSFGNLFDGLRDSGKMPAATEWLLAFSNGLQRYGVIVLLFFAALYAIFRVQSRTDHGRRFIDGAKLKIPLVGGIFRNLSIARFCRVLGTMLKNGVPILRALDISRDATGNRVITEAIEKASENITSGAALSEPLAKSGHFPRNVTEMMSVAEESNTLDSVLVSIADSLEKQTMKRLETMVKLVEPLMLLVMALIIMFVVVALLLPVMKMGEVI